MNDLNNNCERTHLLNHCLNPELNEEEIDNKIVPSDERRLSLLIVCLNSVFTIRLLKGDTRS